MIKISEIKDWGKDIISNKSWTTNCSGKQTILGNIIYLNNSGIAQFIKGVEIVSETEKAMKIKVIASDDAIWKDTKNKIEFSEIWLPKSAIEMGKK